MTSGRQKGFSLLETMIVLTILLIVISISAISLQPMLRTSRVDAAYDTTLMAIRNYRNLAITERKQYIVTFTAPRTITVSYQGVAIPPAPQPSPVVVSTLTLPSDVQFGVQAGFPVTAATVPDGFGSGAAAIDFGQGLGLGTLNYVKLMPDGSSQDTLGNMNSGVLYITRPGEIYSSRAITVFGSTGRIRGYRLKQQGAVNKWVQQ